MFKIFVLSALVACAAAAPHSSSGWWPSSSSSSHSVQQHWPTQPQHQHWEQPSHQHWEQPQHQHIIVEQPQHIIVEQPAVHHTTEWAHVGNHVKHVPVATSHQSRTDYHSKPVVKTVLAPVEYVQPIVHHQPEHVAWTVEQPAVHVVHQHQNEHHEHHAHHEPAQVVYVQQQPQQHIVHVEQPAVQHVYTSGSVQHHGGNHHSSW